MRGIAQRLEQEFPDTHRDVTVGLPDPGAARDAPRPLTALRAD